VLPRHPNYLWAQLADDRLTAGFIADGQHLPAATFKAMLRAKGLDLAHLVSDCTELGGMPPGRGRIGAPRRSSGKATVYTRGQCSGGHPGCGESSPSAPPSR